MNQASDCGLASSIEKDSNPSQNCIKLGQKGPHIILKCSVDPLEEIEELAFVSGGFLSLDDVVEVVLPKFTVFVRVDQ